MVGIPYISQQKCSRIRGANNAKRKTVEIVEIVEMWKRLISYRGIK